MGISYIYAFRFWDWIFLQQYELVSFILIFFFFFHSCFPVSVTGLRITHLDGSSGTDESWIVGFIHRRLV